MQSSSESSNLDFLRAFAVLAVAVSHLGHTLHKATPAVAALGQWGVEIFFIHTSAVLMMSMDRMKARGWNLFAGFYTRRAFRIYPLSMFCILAVVALGIPTAAWGPELHLHVHTPRQIAANLALIMNWTGSPLAIGPLWSLPYELQMYLVLPLLFLLLTIYDSVKAAILVWLVGTLVCSFALTPAFLPALFVPGVPCFLAGVVAYRASKRDAATRLSFWTWAAAIVLGTVAVIAPDAISRLIPYWKMWESWAVCLGLALLFPLCRETGLKFIRGASKAIAKYSYGIYLIHVPVMYVAFIRFGSSPRLMQWTVFLVLASALPILLYHSLEKPMIGAGVRIARFWSSQPARPALRVRAVAASNEERG